MPVTKEQAVAFRIAAQGLGRVDDDGVAAVLALGVQHSGPTAALVLAARLPGPPMGAEDLGLELAWTHRGAPHWHEAGSAAGKKLTLAVTASDGGGGRGSMRRPSGSRRHGGSGWPMSGRVHPDVRCHG
ncbi:MAG TPA: hypothetical protein VGH76_03140 [Actinomycetospora sp.]|uniref:hypothetical protein n=1 Tax=Actinomycetospora sp. TaxID=1872135 RepID=UPI002F3E3E19